MVSRRVKICHTKQSSNSSDNAAQEAVNANLEGNGEPQNPETGPGDLAAETESAPEGAGMASLHDQDEPMHSEPDAELDDTTADSAAPASERPAPTAATNFALAHTSLAYFFSPTPHSPPTRPFSPPSRLLSPISLSAGSPPVAPPPSPASAPYHSPYSAATEPFFHQLSSLPNTQPRLPQMYPGNHNQGQFPYNNNASRWMPPMMAPGNAQHPQQGNIQISIIPVLPSGFNSVPLSAPESVNSPASSGPTPVSHPVAVAPIPEASVPPPSSPSIRVSTPVSSSPSAVSSTAAIELKKNEYKGPLIVSSYPVRPPSQPAQQPAQQQMPFAPRPLAGPIAASPQYFTNHNTGHGFNGNNNNVVGNGHRMNNNVAFAPQHYTPYPHMPMPGQPAITYPRNGPSNFNGHRCLNNNTPTASTNLVRSFPIEDPFQNGPGTRPAPAGAVLKITNIPYNLLTREVMHFLGRRAKLLPENRGSSIHVIMERSTAKTMDCYVELLTQGDAQEALAWVNRNLPAHSPRLGDRHVNVELSSQDELLREMFPRAKCVIWRNGRPEIQPNVDSYSTGFQGFLTNEEMFCMVHHAEAPKRAPFAEKCPQRPYEFMISTLDKFPWFAKTLYTVEHRNVLFDAIRRQLQALAIQVDVRRVIQLDARLLRDLLNAGLRCPAFNERQKYLLRVAAGQEQGGTPRTAMFWPFDTLSRRGNTREESVEEYARLIRAAVLRRVPNIGELSNSWDAIQHGNSPFGPLMLEWRGEGARRSLQAAINTEIGVMRALVSEGLAAINTVV